MPATRGVGCSIRVVDHREVFDQLIRHYSAWLTISNKATSTRHGYLSDLNRFVVWLDRAHDQFPPLGEIKQDDIVLYMAHLTERGNKPRTVRRAVASINGFLGWLVDVKEELDKNPARRLPLPKIPHRLPSFLPPRLVPELLSLPNSSHWLGLRDRALLATLSLSGVRRDTAARLDVTDIRKDRQIGRHFRVIVKGDKEALLPINADLESILDDYIAQRPVTEDAALFITRERLRMSGNAIYERVRKYGELLSERHRLHPHMLRHTFGTWLYQEDVHLVDMKELLCHASIVSTEIYVHTNPQRLRRSVERLRAIERTLQ